MSSGKRKSFWLDREEYQDSLIEEHLRYQGSPYALRSMKWLREMLKRRNEAKED